MEVVVALSQLKEGAEQLKGYWDETGLDMHIAVKENKMIAVSTKHWVRTHYIKTNKTPSELWKDLFRVCDMIGRKLIKSEKGPYVYINKLNIKQTQRIFDMIIEETGAKRDDISRVWELSFNIKDAVSFV